MQHRDTTPAQNEKSILKYGKLCCSALGINFKKLSRVQLWCRIHYSYMCRSAPYSSVHLLTGSTYKKIQRTNTLCEVQLAQSMLWMMMNALSTSYDFYIHNIP